jgi:hypothetical protein
MRWNEQEYADYLKRRGIPGAANTADVSDPPFKLPPPDNSVRFALGRLPVGTMNKTETAYDAYLWQLRAAGQVFWHKFEAVKLRLADNTFYTCDFSVMPESNVLEMHEVKGFWQDDARVKIKVAASIYPFRFVAVTARAKKHGGGWVREEF